MATQLKSTDYQPIPSASPRPNVRVVFSTTSAVSAVAAALEQLPLEVTEATLEELEIRFQADTVIANALHGMSPSMFTVFLNWGVAAARFVGHSDSDEENSEHCALVSIAVGAVAHTLATTDEDLRFETWVAAIEAGDCSPMGPLKPREEAGGLVCTALTGLATDLRHSSAVCRGLDALATKVWDYSNSKSEWAPRLAAAVAAAFQTALDTPRTLPAIEMFTRGEVAQLQSRFMRGPLIHWERAYESFLADDEAQRTLEAAGNYDDAQLDDVAHRRYETLVRLLLTTAPSPAALAIKLALYREEAGWELTRADEIAGQLAVDARRFARLGAYKQPDRPLLDAFEAYREGVTKLEGSPAPGQSDSELEDECYARMDPATDTMLEIRATTVEGVLAKLRHGLMILGPDSWVPDVVVAPGSQRLADGIAMEGVYERMLWGAFRDLAGIAGVSLRERVV